MEHMKEILKVAAICVVTMAITSRIATLRSLTGQNAPSA